MKTNDSSQQRLVRPAWTMALALFVLLVTGCPDPPSGVDIKNGKNKNGSNVDDPLNKNTTPVTKKMTALQRKILGITRSEELLQALSTKMKKLSESFKVDNADTSNIAIDTITIQHDLLDKNLAEFLAANDDGKNDLAYMFYWPLTEASDERPLNSIWSPITSMHRMEDAQIGTLKGHFPDDTWQTFVMETKFEGRIRMDDDRRVGLKGKQSITWKEFDDGNWKIVEWKQKELKLITSPDSLFENVTEKVIPDPKLFETVSRSSHQEMILKRSREIGADTAIRNVREEFSAFSDWESTGQYPNISVVDFDNDGHDDLFLTDRWQSPSLLRNKGDGTFEDATAESGLTFKEFVNCGYFFDFDNDGDADLLVGYSVKPSRFFENKEGKFVPHEKINAVLKDARVVVAAAAADINHDGLLDLYLCTYSSATGPIKDWIKHVTKPSERVKTRLKVERADKFVNRGGPPNILLLNRGDTFEWAKIDDALKQYRSSYQASWMDFDDDGDADLYVCNDFSPDVFLQNNTEPGSFEPKFEDVTKKIAPTVQMGFGMGTSFGDFDNDADLDLYVCNMYSKAGNRIIGQLDEDRVDERLAVGARGNFLYENVDNEFRQIAGDSDDEQHINVVGWSFGGQFADFDNDGRLDLYVPSGFYSAPKEVKTDVDL
ncbi:MAG: VCBS repeat-containing protein [Planctomycetota bacterium]